MPATLPPRFLDSFTPRRQRVDPPRDGAALAALITPDEARRYGTAGGTDLARVENQLAHYKHWVYVAVKRAAEKIAAQTPQVSILRRGASSRFVQGRQRRHLTQSYGYLQAATDDLEPAPEDHPLVELLARVNAEDTWYTFCYETVLYLELTGYLYWLAVPNGLGLPAELHAVPPHWIEPLYDTAGALVAYRLVPYRDEARELLLPPEWVIRARDKHPLSKVDAYSTLEAGADWIDNAASIEQSRQAAFSNGIDGRVMFKLDPNVYKQKPDKAEIERVRVALRQRHADLRLHAGEPILCPPGIDPQQMAHAPREMDFTGSADQVRDNNLALFGTPLAAVGLSKDFNRATAESVMASWCENKIEPRLRFLAAVMTEHLASRYDARLRVWYQRCVPDDAEFELQKRTAVAQFGGLTPNEWREYAGLEPLPDEAYDTGYLGSGMSPVAGRMDEPEPLPETDPAAGIVDDEADETGDTADDSEEGDEDDGD